MRIDNCIRLAVISRRVIEIYRRTVDFASLFITNEKLVFRDFEGFHIL